MSTTPKSPVEQTSVNTEKEKVKEYIESKQNAKLEAVRKKDHYSEMDEKPIKDEHHKLLAAARWLIEKTPDIIGELTSARDIVSITLKQVKDKSDEALSEKDLRLTYFEIPHNYYGVKDYWDSEWGSVLGSSVCGDDVIVARMAIHGYRYDDKMKSFTKDSVNTDGELTSR